MSFFSKVTQQDMNNLPKLSGQETNERVHKIENRNSKQTRDVNLAESLSLITKLLSEVKESTQTLREIITENITPRLAIENTQIETSLEKEQIQPGVM